MKHWTLRGIHLNVFVSIYGTCPQLNIFIPITKDSA